MEGFLYEAAYWTDGAVVHHTTRDWESLPDSGLLWVTVSWGQCRHTLLGADFYWARGNEFGMVYDGSCCEAGRTAWRITPSGAIRLPGWRPRQAQLIRGQMLPDALWAQVRGLDPWL